MKQTSFVKASLKLYVPIDLSLECTETSIYGCVNFQILPPFRR